MQTITFVFYFRFYLFHKLPTEDKINVMIELFKAFA